MTRVGPEWFWQICRFRAEAWRKSFPQKSTPASTFCLLYHIVLDIVEYEMISSTSHQAWLFYSPLALQASLLKDDLLDPVDPLLEDPVLLVFVCQCLAACSLASALTGRPGIAADGLSRCA